MKRSWNQRVVILACVAAIVSGIVALGYKGAFAEDQLSRVQAEKVVRSNTQVNELHYVGITEFSDKRTVHEFIADDGRAFWVDASSGRLLGVVGELTDGRQSTTGHESGVRNLSEAQELATAEVSKHVPELGQMQLVEARELRGGGGYEFRWSMIDENGAHLPQWACITVDAKDGSLGGFVSRFEPVGIDTKSAIRGEAAGQTAGKILSQMSDKYEAESPELRVVRDRDGQERLVWLVAAVLYQRIESSPNEFGVDYEDSGYAVMGATVYIDANTGKDVTGEMH